MYYIKVHRIEKEVIVAACDKEVYARRFKQGKLKFFADPEFYGDKLFGEKEMLELFREATIINLAGSKCIRAAINADLVDPENIIRVESCEHAQVMK